MANNTQIVSPQARLVEKDKVELKYNIDEGSALTETLRKNVLQCGKCGKTCKSMGGLTNHKRSCQEKSHGEQKHTLVSDDTNALHQNDVNFSESQLNVTSLSSQSLADFSLKYKRGTYSD